MLWVKWWIWRRGASGEFGLGLRNWTRSANPTRHDTKLAGYGLKLNEFVSYSD